MKKLFLLGVFTLGLFTTSAMAMELKGDYPACISQESFERLSAILQHKDEAAFKKIMTTECFMPKAGVQIDKVVSRGWTSGIAQVKVYLDGNLYDLWTNTENLASK